MISQRHDICLFGLLLLLLFYVNMFGFTVYLWLIMILITLLNSCQSHCAVASSMLHTALLQLVFVVFVSSLQDSFQLHSLSISILQLHSKDIRRSWFHWWLSNMSWKFLYQQAFPGGLLLESLKTMPCRNILYTLHTVCQEFFNALLSIPSEFMSVNNVLKEKKDFRRLSNCCTSWSFNDLFYINHQKQSNKRPCGKHVHCHSWGMWK